MSWRMRKSLTSLENVHPFLKKHQKVNLGIYTLVSLTFVPGRIMGLVLLGHISGLMKDKVVGNSQHTFN